MRNAIVALKGKREDRGQHAGLLLQRYLAENATGEDGNPEEKRAILEAAINAAANAEVRKIYQAAFDRWKKSLPNLTESCELRTQGRLIVGLGSENVLETGIRLHHTFGMPIIPGSALKGLTAHYCDQAWGQRHVETPSADAHRFRAGRREDRQRNQTAERAGDYHQLLFGSTDDSGCIIFHDAWYIPDSSSLPLVLDVMTPHHPKWNDVNHPVAPTDFDSPTPVPFLSATGQFRVAVSWCGPEHAEAQQWTQLACSLLKQALTEWGVGGKTSSGYGRLVDPASIRHSATAETAGSNRPVTLPNPGDKVEAVLLEEKTKKGGWKATHEASGLSGPIQNSGDVPGDKNPGDRLELILANPQPQFRYPTAADEQRAQQSKSKPRRRQGGGR